MTSFDQLAANLYRAWAKAQVEHEPHGSFPVPNYLDLPATQRQVWLAVARQAAAEIAALH
ncbi:MAG TPA: hypothetical protein PKD73_06160 [Burkholderiaceae bacterium]|nr:hypothetical protein [Burkholderiaceae bacterium]